MHFLESESQKNVGVTILFVIPYKQYGLKRGLQADTGSPAAQNTRSPTGCQGSERLYPSLLNFLALRLNLEEVGAEVGEPHSAEAYGQPAVPNEFPGGVSGSVTRWKGARYVGGLAVVVRVVERVLGHHLSTLLLGCSLGSKL